MSSKLFSVLKLFVCRSYCKGFAFWVQPCFKCISLWICMSIYCFFPPVLCSRWQLSWGRGWKMYTHGGRRKFSERAPILARQKALCCQAGGRSELFKRDRYFSLMAAVWGWTAKYSSSLSHRYSLFFVFSKNFLTFQFQLHHSNCNRVVVTP